MASHGTDQTIVQRLLAARNEARQPARLSWLAALSSSCNSRYFFSWAFCFFVFFAAHAVARAPERV